MNSMLKKMGSIFIAVLFIVSLAGLPAVAQADTPAKAKCACAKGCACDHCVTGKGTCACKPGDKGCHCPAGCKCEHCATGKGMCACKAGAKGCQCGPNCKCEHCATGKGACKCKSDSRVACACKPGEKGCQCPMGCQCPHCAGAAHAAPEAVKPTAEAAYAPVQASKTGVFKVGYTSDPAAVPINKLHTWTLKVEGANGAPVTNAEIAVAGDMPEHGHGMPTEPKVTKNLGDGTYLVEGMKFSMPGWWVVTVTVKAGEVKDTAVFNLQLK